MCARDIGAANGIPEPGTGALFGLGLAYIRRKWAA
jgi:hypothetical protein